MACSSLIEPATLQFPATTVDRSEVGVIANLEVQRNLAVEPAARLRRTSRRWRELGML